MHNARFRMMATIAGATMCAFAAVANGQTPTTTGTTNYPTTTGTTTNGTTNGAFNAPPSTGAVTTDNSVTAPVDNTVPDNTTGSRGFPWGILGLLGLVGLFRGRSTEVRPDVYATTTPGSHTTTVGTGTAYDDRTATPRAAAGTGPSGTRGTMGDSGTRR